MKEEFSKEDLIEIKKFVDGSFLSKAEYGDYCEFIEDYVVFYRKSGYPYMTMPFDVYEQFRTWQKK